MTASVKLGGSSVIVAQCAKKRLRFILVCFPAEIRNEDDLMALASTFKRLTKRDVTLNELFPDFC